MITPLLYLNKVKNNQAAFGAKVIDISNKLGVNPNWLMLIMFSESGLDSTIQNTAHPVQGGYATGLIQFIPTTASALGTTTSALRSMSNLEQLDYVYKYYLPYKSKLSTYVDMYMVTFFPSAAGASKDFIIQAKGIPAKLVRDSNPSFDLNHDFVLTVGEVDTAMNAKVPTAYAADFKKKLV